MKKILYIYYDEMLEEYCVCKLNAQIQGIACVHTFLNTLCLRSGSTLAGKKDFVRKVFKYARKLPIYIHPQCVLFPCDNMQSIQCVWMNDYYIKSVHSDALGRAVVLFENGESICVSSSARSVRAQRLRCKKILAYLREEEV